MQEHEQHQERGDKVKKLLDKNTKEAKKKKQPKKPVQTRSLKKHTRGLKEIGMIYGIGTAVCIYTGLLCGASWMPGNSMNEFLINFHDFVWVKHHFIVGVTEATLPFIGAYWVMFSLAFIMIMTRFEHPFAGQEFGVAKWGNARDFTREFANHDEDAIVVVNTGDSGVKEKVTVNTKNYWIAEDVYLSIDNVKTSNLNMLVVGPPGSGKSFRLARPMLSQLCGNFLTTDPKGGAECSVMKSNGTVLLNY